MRESVQVFLHNDVVEILIELPHPLEQHLSKLDVLEAALKVLQREFIRSSKEAKS